MDQKQRAAMAGCLRYIANFMEAELAIWPAQNWKEMERNAQVAIASKEEWPTHKDFVDWYRQASSEAKREMEAIFKENNKFEEPHGIAAHVRKKAEAYESGQVQASPEKKVEGDYPQIAEIVKAFKKAGVAEEQIANVRQTLTWALQDDAIEKNNVVSRTNPNGGELVLIQNAIQNAGGVLTETKNGILDIQVQGTHFNIQPKGGFTHTP